MKRYVSALLAAAVAAFVSIATMIVMLPGGGIASQNNVYLPTTGVFSGLTAANTINNALDAMLTCHSGSSAPSNALGGTPKLGQCWIDTTSATLPIKKRYTGSAWIVEGVVDVSNGRWTPPVGGGTGTIASSGTTDLCASPQAVQTISGTTTITAFGSNCVVGVRKTLVFSGILTLTHNATSLIIPGGASKTTANGDVAEAVYLGSGNWRVVSYVPIVGTNVTSIAGNTGAFTLSHGLTNSTNDVQVDIASFANYLSGLTLSTAGSSTTFSVAAGAATDSTNADLMKRTASISKTTSAWAVGSATGGLDTGAIATSTWYHVWLIKRPDTGVVDVLVSLSASSPTMPTNYTLKRRIGSMLTNGSSQWTSFTQTGDTFIWSASVQDVSNIATTASRANKTLSAPTGIVVTALFRASVSNVAIGATIFTSLQESDQTPAQTSAGLADLGTSTVGSASVTSGSFERLTDTSAQIGVRSTTTSNTYSIFTYGWIDTRGK